MSEKKYIIFTDLKDFTYKNTLLTDTQIEKILTNFDLIVKNSGKNHNVEIIKSIGDAYFVVGTEASAAFAFSQEILEKSLEYDEKEKIDLKKISLRVTLTYGTITQTQSLDLEDYFGEAINLGARIMDITPTGAIFCTREVHDELNQKALGKYIGDFSFHGVLQEVPLYSLTPISEEQIALLKQRNDSNLKQCEDIVFRSSCVAAILSVQPLPFLENLNLVAVHLYMVLRIAHKFQREISMKESSKIFLEIITPLGLSYAAFQGSASVIKVLLPGIGGYLFAPVSFAVSYALGKIYISYFAYSASGQKMSPEDIKQLFHKHKHTGKKLAKERKKDIFVIGKKYSGEILSLKKDESFHQVQKDTLKMLKSHK